MKVSILHPPWIKPWWDCGSGQEKPEGRRWWGAGQPGLEILEGSTELEQ